MKKIVVLWLFVAAIFLGCSRPPEPASVQVAWIRNAPPTAEVLAGYLSFHNPGVEPLTVTAASSPRFEKIEFHHMRMTDGQMVMRELHSLEVAPRSVRQLSPGNDHLMLIGPTRPLEPAERVPVDLTIKKANGETYVMPLELLVRQRAPH
jgi:copper(I)-binding protein